MNAIRFLGRVFRYALYGGSWTIRSYERKILDAAAQALSGADASALIRQLDYLDSLKRLHNDRMVTFYFSRASDFPLLSNRGDAHGLAKLKLRSDAGRLTVSVVSHRGLLSSLEFTKPPKEALRNGFKVENVQVVAVPPSGIPEEIDREEHG